MQNPVSLIATESPVAHALSAMVAEPLDAAGILSKLVGGVSENTGRAYRSDLTAFAGWLSEHVNAPTPLSIEASLDALCAAPQLAVQQTVAAFVDWQDERGLAGTTIARRLAALRSALRIGRAFGATSNTIEVRGPRAERRDVRGPEVAEVGLAIKLAGEHADPVRAARDVAIMRALADGGLRRNEVLSLDRKHVHLGGSRPEIEALRKGKKRRKFVPLARPTADALKRWLAVHPMGDDPEAPVFVRFSTQGVGRLTGDGLYKLVRGLLQAVGVDDERARPHGLRHMAATAACKLTDGNVERVRRFTAHASLAVLSHYLDEAEDDARQVGELVAASINAHGGAA